MPGHREIIGLNPRALLRLLPSALVLGLAVWARPHVGELSGEQQALLGYVPYLLLLVCITLAYQFNRVRFVLLSLLTGACFWVIQSRLQVSLLDADPRNLFAAVCFVFPLATALLLAVPERGIWNRYGAIYTVALIALVALGPLLVKLMIALLGEHPQWLQIWPTENMVLPRSATLMFGVVAIIGLVLLCWRNSEAEVALLGSLGSVFLVLAWFELVFVSAVLFSAAAFIQLISILRSSHEMAYRDDLTGLLGRRALNERLQGLGSRYCLAMLDIDHFKKFNDTHGHDVGDDVLKLVATRIGGVKGGGTAFRYGGEEFCVVFPRRSAEDCVAALEAVRESIADYTMTLRDTGKRPTASTEGVQRRGRMASKLRSGSVSVTISIGLAERSDEQGSAEDVIKLADKQLYRAKKAGRNRLCH
jgi:diguanylate cyclase (GGDEF)-like protein